MKRKQIFKTALCALFSLAAIFTCPCRAPASFGVEALAVFSKSDAVATLLPTAGASDFKPFTKEALRGLRVIPGGMAFGTKYQTEGITVAGFSEAMSERENPASLAGLRVGDLILACNGEDLHSSARLSELVTKSGGKTIYLTCRRGGKTFTAKVTPKKSADGDYQIGLLLQDSGAGIGTVTFILEDSLAFAGLGHGICNGDTGELVHMTGGNVYDVTIRGVKRGEAGDPGELRGYFDSEITGELLGNSQCGVFGVLDQLPAGNSTALPVGLRDDIHEGDAILLCTTSERGVESFSVRISAINRAATGPKCFTVTVIDKELLARTGGIVQGMSGSPILQDGKLVGAVTHVLVNEPAVGYGIFLENMLTRLPLDATENAAA